MNFWHKNSYNGRPYSKEKLSTTSITNNCKCYYKQNQILLGVTPYLAQHARTAAAAAAADPPL